MKIVMRDHFGSFLADGDLGNMFRFCEIDPLFGRPGLIFFDFAGVANMSDSFANACFGNLQKTIQSRSLKGFGSATVLTSFVSHCPPQLPAGDNAVSS